MTYREFVDANKGKRSEYLWDRMKNDWASLTALLAAGGTGGGFNGLAPVLDTSPGEVLASTLPQTREALNVQQIPMPKNYQGRDDETARFLGLLADQLAMAPLTVPLAVVGGGGSPALSTALEAMNMAGGAVTGYEGGKIAENMGKDRDIGEAIGSLLGTGPAYLASKLAKTGGRAAGGAIDKIGGSEKQAGELARSQLGRALEADPKSAARAAESKAIADKINAVAGEGEFKPTLAQMTGSPGVIAIEHSVSAASPENLARKASMTTESEHALQSAGNQMFPTEPGTVMQQVKNEADLSTQFYRQSVEKYLKDLGELRSRLGGHVNEAAGQKMIQLREKFLDAARKQDSDNYKRVYQIANAEGVRIPAAMIYQQARTIAGQDINAFQTLPSIWNKLKQWAPKERGEGINWERVQHEPVSFEEFHSFYKELNRLLFDPGTSQAEKYLLGQLKEQSGNILSQFEKAGSRASSAFRQANEFHKTEIEDVFRSGIGSKMVAETRHGEITAAEDLVRKLIAKKGGTTPVTQYLAMFKGDPEAIKTLEDGAFSMFVRDVINPSRGVVDAGKVNRFMTDHQVLIDSLPGLKAKIIDTKIRADALVERAQAIKAFKQEMDQSVITKMAGAGTVDDAIGIVLREPARMDEFIKTMAANPDAKRAVLRGIMGRITESNDPMKILEASGPNIKKLANSLDPKAWENLLVVAQAKTILRRAPTPETVHIETVVDPLLKMTGTAATGFVSRFMTNPIMSRARALASVVSRYGLMKTQQKADKLLADVLYEPEKAAGFLDTIASGGKPIPRSGSFAYHEGAHVARSVLMQIANVPDENQENVE